jgi:transcriptional regulator with XRE-family HTH domain
MEMSNEKEKFSQRLNEALNDMNYPPIGHGRQSALSKELKIKSPTIGRWLNGEDFPKTSELVKISQFLDVRSNWLLSGVGSKYPRKSDQAEIAVRKKQEEVSNASHRLDKEAFEMALAWMKLPDQQRLVLRKVIEELIEEEVPASKHEEIKDSGDSEMIEKAQTD